MAEEWLTDSDREKLRAIYQSSTVCFSDLVRTSGLNPSVDFRFSDLTGVDFFGSDLRGYNFVGANLSYTRWFRAVWDETTNLEGALLTGSKGHDRARAQSTTIDHVVQPFFENTPMAIATVNRFGKVLRANSRFTNMVADLASSREGDTVLSMVHARDGGALAEAIRRAAEGRSDSPPLEARLNSDRERWGQFFVAADDPLQNTAHVYILDITEGRKLQSQLNQAQKMEMVGQLAGGIAHDFNNVLSSITMAADFMLNSHKPTDPSFHDLMQIKQNTIRAATLVRQLLAFSRRQTLRPQILDVSDALSDLTMLVRRLISDDVKLEIRHGPDLWSVKVDISQFEQVIVNLVVNARDAMPEGGVLSIMTSNVTAVEASQWLDRGVTEGDYVRIEINDTGVGIDPEIADRIFDPFFSTKSLDRATGLGLSTVLGIVKQSQGHLFFDSTMGSGTSFSILLPRYFLSPEKVALSNLRFAPWHKAEEAMYVETIRVLLVEPDASLRSLNARGLRVRRYDVVEAGDGVEALAQYVAHGARFDVIVSEIGLPEMSGPTLYREVRKRNAEQLFIFVSSYVEEAFEQRFPEDEMIPFLPKPFSIEQLTTAVTNIIGLTTG